MKRVLLLALVAVVITACQSTGPAATPPAATESAGPTTAASATPAATPRDESAIEGTFVVDGRELFLSCVGEGGPTIVYLTGMGGVRSNAGIIPDAFTDRLRWCAYDRPNAEFSQSAPVTGLQTGADAAADLHGVLEAAGVPGPYLLVGASFGGLLAITFAGTYPSDVVGMVLLDATLPTQDEIHAILPDAVRPGVIGEAEANPEGFDYQATLDEAKALMPELPQIPVTYIGAEPIEPPVTYVTLDMDPIIEATHARQEAFVSMFDTGTLVYVDTPHFMEPAVPGRIIEEIERILDLAAA